MPDIRFHCQHCKGKLVVDQRAMGRSVACPECGQIVKIPLRSEDPVETAAPVSQPQSAPAAGGAGDTCTRCGKKVIFDKNDVRIKCNEARIPLAWGSMSPTLVEGSHTATGFNEIVDILSRASQQHVETFQSIIGSWAPSGRCSTCGELWCQECIMGPMPYGGMGIKKPHCKCG